MPGTVDVRELDDFRADLARIGGALPQAVLVAHKEIADRVARDARSNARGMGGVQARAASAIGGKATRDAASVGVFPSAVDRMGNVAFWGAKRRTGWYAAPRYRDSAPQHPPWVGNTWDVGVRGQGPYAINDAVAENIPQILDEYGDMIVRASRDAFPEGGL